MRKRTLILTGLGCFLGVIAPLLVAPTPTDLEKKKQDSLRTYRKAKVISLLQAYPGVKYLIRDEVGVPSWLDGHLSEGLVKGDPADMAYQFFEKNRELYGLTDPRSELKVTGVDKDELGRMVALQQYYRNVEVRNAVVKASFGRDGNLCAISGFTYPDINVSTTPTVDSKTALSITKRDLGLSADYRSKDMETISKISGTRKVDDPGGSALLCIMPFENKYLLVWLVRVHKDRPLGAWEYFIDANSGEILRKANRLIR